MVEKIWKSELKTLSSRWLATQRLLIGLGGKTWNCFETLRRPKFWFWTFSIGSSKNFSLLFSSSASFLQLCFAVQMSILWNNCLKLATFHPFFQFVSLQWSYLGQIYKSCHPLVHLHTLLTIIIKSFVCTKESSIFVFPALSLRLTIPFVDCKYLISGLPFNKR